ncbi:MAG TPA: DUF4249 domain-containing protein [Flavitalea sp.]|nr:DUF4249 domain-containing protein [Flavitalea sp.]
MLRILTLIASGFFFISCEKAITFRPDQSTEAVVIEGIIENNQAPVVILSRSRSFFSAITPAQLAASFIRNAAVTISNGTLTHQLKERHLEIAPGYDFYYYSNDSLNAATAFKGEFGKTYSLQVNVDGKVFTAQTTIPFLTKMIDSIWWKKAPDNPDSNKVILMARTTDPPGYGNYIRYFTSTNDGPFYPGITSVYDDQIVDGKTYSVQIEKGVNRNESIDFENYSFFQRGDTVKVKLTNIDKATFDFWRTMEYSYSSIGNPFSSPTRVLGNTTGGSLGYFGGYAVQYVQMIIPK